MTMSINCVITETGTPVFATSAISGPDICTTKNAGSNARRGANGARKISINSMMMNSAAKSCMRPDVPLLRFKLATWLATGPARWTFRPGGAATECMAVDNLPTYDRRGYSFSFCMLDATIISSARPLREMEVCRTRSVLFTDRAASSMPDIARISALVRGLLFRYATIISLVTFAGCRG